MPAIIIPGKYSPGRDLAGKIAKATGLIPTWCAIPGYAASQGGVLVPQDRAKTVGGRLGDAAPLGSQVWTQAAVSERLQYPGRTPSGAFTVFVAAALSSANGLANARLISNWEYPAVNYWDINFVTSTSRLAFGIYGSSSSHATYWGYTSTAVFDGGFHTHAVTWNGTATLTAADYYFDGTLVTRIEGTAGSALNPGAENDITVGNIGDGGTILDRAPAGSFYLAAVFPGVLYAPQMQELHALARYGDHQKKKVLYFSSTGAATHNLEGAAAAQSTASAALSVSVPLAAAGLSVATATGALSLSILFEAAAIATANTSGGLSLSIPLAASAVAQALASAGITQATPLGGDAAAVADAPGALSLNISLAGNAIAEAASSAGLTVATSGLAGDAAAQASASAALTLAIALAGASLAVSGASGNLTQLVPLSGSAASASTATGGLDVSVQLSGAALAQALSAAGLSVDGGMGAAAAAEASAGGTITLRVNLDGAAVAQAIAAGALSADGVIVAGTPGYKVSRTPRTWKVTRTPRTWKVTRAPRSWRISA